MKTHNDPLSRRGAGFAPALVADFDGTLIRGDAFAEAVVSLALRAPLKLMRLVFSTRCSLPKLKAAVAQVVPLNPSSHVWRPQVLDLLREQAKAGRTVVLATATTTVWAREVADFCACFSHVVASDGTRNLKGEAKFRALSERGLASGGFGYLGDSAADLPLFRAATAERVVVGGKRSVCRRLKSEGLTYDTLDARRPADVIQALARGMRPVHWVKNLLIFIPAFTSWGLYDPARLENAFMAFLAFCLTASAVYLVNDMADTAADRAHPEKRRRPLAAGDLSVQNAAIATVLLVGAGSAAAVISGVAALIGIVAYIVVNLAYSSFLKEKPLLDIAALCFFYMLRIVVGVYALGADMSVWFLGFLLCLFAELAFWKRYVESRSSSRRSIKRRGYSRQDAGVLLTFGVGFSFSAALVLVLYLLSGSVSPVYASPVILVALAPLMLLHNLGMWLEASRGGATADPVMRLLRSKQSRLTAVAALLIVVAARTLNVG